MKGRLLVGDKSERSAGDGVVRSFPRRSRSRKDLFFHSHAPIGLTPRHANVDSTAEG